MDSIALEFHQFHDRIVTKMVEGVFQDVMNKCMLEAFDRTVEVSDELVKIQQRLMKSFKEYAEKESVSFEEKSPLHNLFIKAHLDINKIQGEVKKARKVMIGQSPCLAGVRY